MTLQTNAAAVRSLLDRFTVSTPDNLTHALNTLTAQVKLSMQNTQAYTIPLDQQLPAEHPIEVAAAFVHPYNVAAALVSLAVAAPQVGRDVVAPDPTAMVYVPELGGWKAVGAVQLVPVPVQISLAPPPAPAAAVPPPPPAAPAAVPLPPAPKGDIVDMVNASLGDLAAPAAVAATPTVPTRGPGAPAAPIEGTATRVATSAPQHVTYEQALKEAEHAEAAGLPDPSVLAARTGAHGRPAKSPFEFKIEKRSKISTPPWWWGYLDYSAKRLFCETPPNAVDPESKGSGPVQAYALAVTLAQELLRCADGDLTVAELRTYLREIDTGLRALPASEAIYQLVDHLYAGAGAGEGEGE